MSDKKSIHDILNKDQKLTQVLRKMDEKYKNEHRAARIRIELWREAGFLSNEKYARYLKEIAANENGKII